MKHSRKNQGGYSVLELIIYLAIFAIITTVLMRSLVTVMRTYSTAHAYRVLQSNGDFAMERITRELRRGKATSAASTFGSHPGSLTIAGFNDDLTSFTETFSVSNGALQFTDGTTTGALTTEQVLVSNLVFRKITNATTEAVKVELTLSTAKGTPQSATFNSTVTLRGI